MTPRVFPDGFLWGASTSAQQIEGAARADGRSESIWDRFASVPGNIEDGSNPSVACDHYHRYAEDVALMRDLGLGAYRFSVAWPRVLPAGRGAINGAGLDFYDRLVDALLAAGITPFITLYHWDLPQALQDRGGWGSRETAHAFVEFTGAVTRRLGDRVGDWITHNEPWCVARLGHGQGQHAPGLRDPALALRVAHHVLLSHGWALRTIRRDVPDARVGIAPNLTPVEPATVSAADRDAARRLDAVFNRWYLDPLFRGVYPQDAIDDEVRLGVLESPELPFVRDGDLQAIAAPLDFLGINYYSRAVVRADGNGEPVAVPQVPAEERTDMGWEVFPDGLHRILLRVQREYDPPAVYVTENGCAYTDPPAPDGSIPDTRRIEYLHEHLTAAHRAIADGVPLRGYFHWSLMDNFEWGQGYTKRFGLAAVDYDTQQRTPRASAAWYRNVATANSIAPQPQPST